MKNGFSLIESLISMTLFLFLILSSLEFFGFARAHFIKLKEGQETNAAAYAALDKIRGDILFGGMGLSIPGGMGVLKGISKNGDTLIIHSREKSLSLTDDLVAGQTKIHLESTKAIKKSREICVYDKNQGEIQSISSVDQESIILSSPLTLSYSRENTRVVLLKKISIYLDKNKQILRRKVNSSPSQPLLEEVDSFDFDYEESSNLVRLRLCPNSSKEKEFNVSVFTKNIALASIR